MRTTSTLLITAMVLLGACGDDSLDEQQFVDELTGYSVPEPAARCVFAEIADDPDVISDIKANGVGDDVSSATADRLEKILTSCLRQNSGSDSGSDADSDAGTTTTESR